MTNSWRLGVKTSSVLLTLKVYERLANFENSILVTAVRTDQSCWDFQFRYHNHGSCLNVTAGKQYRESGID